jgi:ribose transport system permease protein
MLVAMAQRLALISGGFDLSVGSNIALTSIVSSSVMLAVQEAYPDGAWLAVFAGFLATLGVGVFAGVCNAFGVAVLDRLDKGSGMAVAFIRLAHVFGAHPPKA